MRTSANGLAFIRDHEGCELHAYPDPGSGGEPWTIGVGHTGGVKPGDTCTMAVSTICSPLLNIFGISDKNAGT